MSSIEAQPIKDHVAGNETNVMDIRVGTRGQLRLELHSSLDCCCGPDNILPIAPLMGPTRANVGTRVIDQRGDRGELTPTTSLTLGAEARALVREIMWQSIEWRWDEPQTSRTKLAPKEVTPS